MSGSLMALSFTPTTTQLVFPSFSGATFRKHRYYCLAPPPQTQTQMIALCSTQAATPTTSTRMPVSRYLIERLGFSEAQSLTVSSKLINRRTSPHSKTVTDLISSEKADTVISYLQDGQNGLGLDLSQVKKLVTMYPAILMSNVDKTLKPEVKLLQDLGFTTSDLAYVFSKNPTLYLDRDISPAIQALRGIMGSDEYVVKFFRRLTRGLASTITNNLIPNVTMLENEYDIPRDKLRKFLGQQPCVLMLKTEVLRDRMVMMEDKWGITRDAGEFLRALHAFCSLSDESINSKCQVLQSCGWSNSDVLSLIRRFPSCLTSSEARLKKSLEFYMNELGYESSYMASRPALFNYSLENRVVPRHRVVLILKEKGLIKADLELYSAIHIREDEFLRQFVLRFKQEIPKLHEVYIKCKENPKAPLPM